MLLSKLKPIPKLKLIYCTVHTGGRGFARLVQVFTYKYHCISITIQVYNIALHVLARLLLQRFCATIASIYILYTLYLYNI